MISVPCTLIGVLAGAFCSLHVGKELAEDPEYLRRVANKEFTSDKYKAKGVENHHAALLSVIIFIAATIGIVLFGSMTERALGQPALMAVSDKCRWRISSRF